MMDDFEARLKSLSLAKPSDELRKQIFDNKPIRPQRRGARAIQIPLSWAAALSLFMGLGGFLAASLLNKEPPAQWQASPATVSIQIVEPELTRHVFDFTEASQDFLPGDFQIQVKTNGEV